MRPSFCALADGVEEGEASRDLQSPRGTAASNFVDVAPHCANINLGKGMCRLGLYAYAFSSSRHSKKATDRPAPLPRMRPANVSRRD
jgi:hypothetical protein